VTPPMVAVCTGTAGTRDLGNRRVSTATGPLLEVDGIGERVRAWAREHLGIL